MFLETHQLHVDVLLLEFKQLLLLAQKLFAHPLSLLLLALLQRSGVTLNDRFKNESYPKIM